MKRTLLIRWDSLGHLLGFFILGIAVSMLAPIGLALYFGDQGLWPLLKALALTASLGAGLAIALRPEPHEITHREGILFVCLAWFGASALGSLPYYFSESFPSYTDSFFEGVSGFTATGATVLSDIEAVPKSLLFWRCMTQWIGGMGIILLGIAILPLLGTGGMELYRAEFSGARSEKLKPRIAETALALWKIYVSFSVAAYVCLRLAGMDPFDAICHTFTTVATGGFSPRGASVESFQSPAIEYIVVFFMMACGVNFTRHYRLFVERRVRDFFDVEVRTYLAILGAITLVIAATLLRSAGAGGEESFRLALFQTVSIGTTTGFSSVDFETWTPFAKLLLLALMFVGGCTGSTAGGMKVARIILLFRVVGRQFRQMVERRGVFAVRFGGKAVSEQTINSLLNLVYIALMINFAACMALTAAGVDVFTAISAVAATMFNIGPGLGDVGPADHYGSLPGLAKWVLSFCMLAGRLEFYTVLVIFTAAFWRK
jgi:trk system potassium uptake protein